MIATVWRFRPVRGHEAEFEAAYGPNGAWATLFRASAGYVRTDLLHGEAGVYLTIDIWRAAGDFERFLSEHREAYERLDAQCETLTMEEEKLGVFTLVD